MSQFSDFCYFSIGHQSQQPVNTVIKVQEGCQIFKFTVVVRENCCNSCCCCCVLAVYSILDFMSAETN